jgi:hypothetical protein
MKFNGNLRTYRNSFTTNPPFEHYYSTTNNNQTTANNAANNVSTQNNNPGATTEEIPAIRSGSPQFTTPKRRVSYKTITSNGGPIIPVINLAAAAQKTPASTNNSGNTDNFAMGETPFKDLAPDTSAKAQVQAEYTIGDLVDGECTVSSGHKRWFPGKILEVKKEVANGKQQVIYIIQFNDGEISSDKSFDEVRFTKNRQAKKSNSNNNNSNNSNTNNQTTGSNSMDSHLQPVTPPQPKSNPPPSVVPLLSINKPNKNSSLEKGLFPDAVNSPEMLLSPCTEQTISPLNSSRNQLLSSSIPPTKDLQKKDKTKGEDSHPVVVPILLTGSLNSMSFVKQVEDFTEREEDAGTSDDEQSEEDRVFEIPSIFDSHHRNTTNRKALEGMKGVFCLKEFHFKFVFL